MKGRAASIASGSNVEVKQVARLGLITAMPHLLGNDLGRRLHTNRTPLVLDDLKVRRGQRDSDDNVNLCFRQLKLDAWLRLGHLEMRSPLQYPSAYIYRVACNAAHQDGRCVRGAFSCEIDGLGADIVDAMAKGCADIGLVPRSAVEPEAAQPGGRPVDPRGRAELHRGAAVCRPCDRATVLDAGVAVLGGDARALPQRADIQAFYFGEGVASGALVDEVAAALPREG